MTLIESTPDAGTGALIRQDPLLMPDPEPLFSKCYKFENGRDPRGHPSPLDLFKPWSMAAAVGVAELAKPDTPRRIEIKGSSCSTSPEGTDSGSCWRARGYLPGDHTVKARGAKKGRVRQSLSPDDPRHQASVRQSSLEREARITDIGGPDVNGGFSCGLYWGNPSLLSYIVFASIAPESADQRSEYLTFTARGGLDERPLFACFSCSL
ncbi:unnamed protein product [Vicia faba]|uniref:Uncharacterized protein n=2 Tax=IRL clade TaxID=2233839 RepID=A0AAV1ADX9_VICFA|nr:unnamed protein product [Vicia faba]CAI8608166.1 unnamed protein product [Vicia faba]